MPNLLILLTLPEDIRFQYRDRLKALFPELTINIADADMLLTFAPMMSDKVLQDAKTLKWVQALGTGVDNLIDLPSLRKDVLITNMWGIHCLLYTSDAADE